MKQTCPLAATTLPSHWPHSACLVAALTSLLSLAACGAETVAAGPMSVPASRPLNNLVTELLDLRKPALRPEASWRFSNPHAGWLFLRSSVKGKGVGKVQFMIEPISQRASTTVQPAGLSAEDARYTLTHEAGGSTLKEAMRFLRAGEYRLTCHREGDAALERVTLRAVPELIFCKYQYDPLVPPHGPYDWTFLEKHVLTNVNCIVGSGADGQAGFVQRWKQQGKRWIVECGVPALDGKQPLTADEAFTYWARNPGFQSPNCDGVVADEFLGNRRGMKYPEWTEAVRRIHADEKFRHRFFYPYCAAIYRDPVSAEFLRVVMASGYPFAWEVYLQEQPDAERARGHLQSKLAAEMRRWHEALPGCERHMIVCLGYMSLPTTESLNVNPHVDYKVWMDLQFQHLATAPEFRGLYGLMEYTSGYADDETVRWASRLYRHYGIEGKTNLLSDELGFRHRLDHLQNADFANGTEGWRVDAAEAGSVATNGLWGFGWLEGRYPRTKLGDTFLWTKRSALCPNRVTQEIRNLRPGRLYSLKLVTADYQELTQGKSVEQKHAVSIQLGGAKILAEKSFQQPMANNYAHTLGAFKDQNKFWMNDHFLVFRAKGRSAKLTISDWASGMSPGGPEGQELIYNFMEVQPYFEP